MSGERHAYDVVEIVDAALTTRRHAARPPRRYDRWWVWAGVVIVFLFVVQPAVTAVFQHAGQGFVFTADSMAPTLLSYDYSTTRNCPSHMPWFRGWLPAQDVVGRVNLVYFSQEPFTGAIRWERVHLPVR